MQVPEGLDRPVTDDSLRIPDPTAATPDIRGVTAPGDTLSSGEVAGADSGTFRGDTFILGDTMANAWRRVGLALGRMEGQVAIAEQDEAAGRYRLTVSGSQETRGFFRRLFKRDERVSETFDLMLTTDAAGTRIQAVGGGEMARDVLSRLKQRLD